MFSVANSHGGETMAKTGDVLWGALGGAILGFIVAKVFETWAILFSRYGVHNGSYQIGPLYTPLWIQANNHPTRVAVVVVILYAILGVLFVLYLHHRAACEQG